MDIKDLIKKGFNKNQAAIILKMQQGGKLKPSNVDTTTQNLDKNNPLISLQVGGNFNGYVPESIGYQYKPETYEDPFNYKKYEDYSEGLDNKYPLPDSNYTRFSQYGVIDPNDTPSSILDKDQPMWEDTTNTGTSSVEQPQKPNIYNPYGGVDLETALYTAGQGFGEKDAFKASTGLGASLLKVGRIGLSGYATGKENQRVAEEMRKKQFEDMRRPSYKQEGGKITKADEITGKYIVDQKQGNVNLEHGEIVQDLQTGNIQEVVGETHKKGGVTTSLEDANVLSNYTKLGAKNAKELKEKYNLSLKATDTYAKAMDKFNKKIGVDEIVDSQAKNIEKIGENSLQKNQSTQKVNDEYLNNKTSENEEKLEVLKDIQSIAFQDIFERQEQVPKKGDGTQVLDSKGNPTEVAETPVAQEGGHIEALAQKYGITPERAHQLLQEGGQTQPTEQAGAPAPEDIITAFAQATQQDPQEIANQLQQMNPEEQQQALMSMVQQLQESPQQEEEQPMMQEGGYTKKEQERRLGDFYNQVSGLGYTGKKDIGTMQKWMASNYPNEVVKYFTENGQPLTAKHVDIIKDKYKTIFKETGISPSKKSEDYTSEEKLKLQTALGEKADNQFLLEGFQDNKWDWRFPMTTINNKIEPITTPQSIVAPLPTASPIPQKATVIDEPQGTVDVPQTIASVEAAKAQGNPTIAPNLPDTFNLPPSAMQAIAKPYVPFGRMTPVKITPETSLAEADRQRQTALESLRATGLPPQVQEALSAQQLASSQIASNDAIAKAEQFNAQNQYQTDQFNIGQATKEALTNEQFNQGYQDKMMATMANQERDTRRYFNNLNQQNRQNFEDVANLNFLNATRENYYANTDGTVTYVKPQTPTLNGALVENLTKAQLDEMKPEQALAYMKKRTEESEKMRNYKKA